MITPVELYLFTLILMSVTCSQGHSDVGYAKMISIHLIFHTRHICYIYGHDHIQNASCDFGVYLRDIKMLAFSQTLK